MTAKAHRQAPEGARLYDIDVVAWANEQARLLRSGRLDQLDIEHTAEETLLDQTLVRVDRETYEHFLAVLDQPQPERVTSASWPLRAHGRLDPRGACTALANASSRGVFLWRAAARRLVDTARLE